MPNSGENVKTKAKKASKFVAGKILKDAIK